MQTHQDVWFSVSDQFEHIFFRACNQPTPILDFIPWPIRVPGIMFADGTSMSTADGGGGGGGTPAGANTQVQYNNNEAFGASPNLTWDGSLGVNGFIRSSGFMPVPTSGRALELNYVEGEGGYVAAVDRSTNTNLTLFLQGDGAGISLSGNVVDMAAADTIQMATRSLTRVLVDSTGRVGVNTASPAFLLDVAGDVNITDPGGANGYAFRVNGAAGMTTSITLQTPGVGTATLNFTGGILTSIS